MKRKAGFIYIPCQGRGLLCKEMHKEVQIGVRFRLNPDKTVLSVLDNETINFCPFCGKNIFYERRK